MSEKVPTSLEGLIAAADAAQHTPRHTFTIPVSLQKHGYSKVTLRELIGLDEINAHAKSANVSGVKLAISLIETSLVSIETMRGDVIKFNEYNVSTEYGKLPPKIRNLILSAYQEIHNPKEEDVADFLKSCQVAVTG